MINNKLLLTFAMASVLTVSACGSQPTTDGDGGEDTSTAPVADQVTETAEQLAETASEAEGAIAEAEGVITETQNSVETAANDAVLDVTPGETVDADSALTIGSPSDAADLVAAMPETNVIYFEFDSSDVLPEFKKVVAAHAAYIYANPEAVVFLEGHADERGSIEYNVALGKRRADSVATMLKLLGVSSASLPDDQIVSYGESRPAVRGSMESAWSKNRRVEFRYE